MKAIKLIVLLLCLGEFCPAQRKDLLLIPGLGFDESVFSDFMERNEKIYRIHSITVAGFGNTPAPAEPDSTDASYGFQSWTMNAVEQIKNTIIDKHLRKPIVIGHFVLGAQIALRLAIDFPDLIGGVIIVGAPAKFIPIVNGEVTEYPLNATVKYIDKYTGPVWFGTMSKEKFDQGNYLPEVYSLNPEVGRAAWSMSARVPMPVYVRYLCEFFASDITLEAGKIICPVLILRSMFTPGMLNIDVNNYIRPQFIDSWERMAESNPKIIIQDVLNSASFIWKDQPEIFDEAVRKFAGS